MRQCTVKPAWIGHALKRRSYWEGQTRLIPSLFYMLSFHVFLKQKTVKRTLLQTDNIFSPQLKKTPCLMRTKISGISEKKRIKLNIFVNFLKKKHFFTLQSNIFFYFNLKFWRVQFFWLELAQSFIPSCSLQPTNNCFQTRYLLFQVALCNQPTNVFAPLKAILTFKPYCTSLWTTGFSTVTYIKLWWSVKDLQKNALKI